MNEIDNRSGIHLDLLKEHVGAAFTEDDALCWMVLLHTHAIRLRSKERSGGVALSALTQRHAAEVVAALWAEHNQVHDERNDYTYWYWQYALRTPYEILDDVPKPQRTRLLKLRSALAEDSRVEAVEPED